ncbi:uncharacterized protein LOC134179565 [Corticium candelabrum]|uniref:uncharacterized protein LOC134179565 n=1 Tax=Corticium candelabrum TaxID=121492 RepID=UPI002E262E35|nr:uncharacterized protein LOC134179565 [Corticium candelabrum]
MFDRVIGEWNQTLPLTTIGALWSRNIFNVNDLQLKQFQVFSMSPSFWILYKDCEHINISLYCVQCRNTLKISDCVYSTVTSTSLSQDIDNYSTSNYPTQSQSDGHSSGSGVRPLASSSTSTSSSWTFSMTPSRATFSPKISGRGVSTYSSVERPTVNSIGAMSEATDTVVSSDVSTELASSSKLIGPISYTVTHLAVGSVEFHSTQVTDMKDNSVNLNTDPALSVGIGVSMGAAAVCLLLLTVVVLVYCVWSRQRKERLFSPTSPRQEWGSYGDWLYRPTYSEPSSSNEVAVGYLQPVSSVRPSQGRPFQVHSADDGDYEYAYAYLGQEVGISTGSASQNSRTSDHQRGESVIIENLYATVTKYKKHKTAAVTEILDAVSTHTNEEVNGVDLEEIDHQSAYSNAEESYPAHQPSNIYRILDSAAEYESHLKNEDNYWSPANSEQDLYAQLGTDTFLKIDEESVRLEETIGSGEFGIVSRALWYQNSNVVTVAVKTLKSRKEDDRVRFFQEAAIVGQFYHQNVVALHGIILPTSVITEDHHIVFEYMSNGALKDYLVTLKLLEPGNEALLDLPKRFLMMMRDIASGMAYLAKKSFVHRDLAARNIMLDHTFTCKIADFGLSRDLANDYYVVKRGGKIPVRWTAPEAIKHRKYSSSSDIWSYGIVAYEIWSLGERPYGSWSNQMYFQSVNFMFDK